jgi:glycosyltransferase involved in cell wall biosynthesis
MCSAKCEDETAARMKACVYVIGHRPPPVTGENLCRAHLITTLRQLGLEVKDPPRGHPGNFMLCKESIWLMAGASRVGHVRDVAFLLCWLLLGCQVHVYIHNQAWQYFQRRAWFWRVLGGSRLRFVVLTESVKSALWSAGLRAVRLNNTLAEGAEPVMSVSPKAFRLVWMGAVTESKGFPKALEVFETLRLRHADWSFDVYGSGPLVPAKGRSPGVTFHGFVDAVAKEQAWRTGGVFILPSTYVNETQPLAIVEGLAHGVPFVATPIGGIPAMLGEVDDPAGILLPATASAAVWADEIERMMSDYSRWSAAARRTYGRLFSREAYAVGLSDILKGATVS